MKKYVKGFIAFLVLAVAVAVGACASPIRTNGAQPASVNQVETAVAMTLQSLSPETTTISTSVPESSTNLLPHSLYFLANDSQANSQIYRLERDGKTKTQLTLEPVKVWDYDVSPVDGSIAYEANHQLVLINADGSNRRVLVEGIPNPDVREFYSPVFSPDGQTLAYAHKGLNLYSISTGLSSLVIEDQFEEVGNGQQLPIETYSPEHYSPDGTKLLLALGHWEVLPSHAVYDPGTNALVRYSEVQDYIYCCSFHGGPVWSSDSSSFYGVASVHDTAYRSGELWKIDAENGSVTRMLKMGDGTFYLPFEPYPAPDGQLYYFFGTYHVDSGFFDPPVLELVRSAPDGVTDRTVLRDENFVLIEEALWAPDASFVIAAMSVGRDWDLEGGVLELYYTDGQKGKVWLAPFGQQMKWGP
ncbi:MAG: hypothetical protein EHM33_02345 [Chloroflexi bacterium]|nr:MAG: hypothetical protein EHM33_02345 [Chloroflexota bacterium]